MNNVNKKDLKHIRFEQRLVNFDKSYKTFKEALKRDTEKDEIARAGLIQIFEFTFELAWKTMKDKLSVDGIEAPTPREVLQEAFQAHYSEDNGLWSESLKRRNESAHKYDESFAKEIDKFIRNEYAPILEKLHAYFNQSK